MAEKGKKYTIEELKAIQKARLEKKREEWRKMDAEVGRLGHVKQGAFISQESIDRLVARKPDVKKIIITFPKNSFNEEKTYPLEDLDFSSLSSLDKIEEIGIYHLIADSLGSILQHTKNVCEITLGKTGPVTAALLGEMNTLVPNLKRLNISHPPGNSYQMPDGWKLLHISIDPCQDEPDSAVGALSIECTDIDPYEDYGDEQKSWNRMTEFQNMDFSFLDLPPYRYKAADLIPIGDFVALQELSLWAVDIDQLDLSFLNSLKDLRSFKFNQEHYYKLTQVKASAYLQDNYGLNIRTEYQRKRYPIQRVDLTPFTSCQKLRNLKMSGMDISTISLTPLSSCGFLESLDLSSNSLASVNLSPLKECPNLQHLRLDENKLEQIDLMPLSDCQHIESVDLSKNTLKDADKISIPKNWSQEVKLDP